MGEKKVLTEEMITEKLEKAQSKDIRFIDPMKLAFWSVETASAMADGTVGEEKIRRAIRDGELTGYQQGKSIGIIPQEFITWLKRAKV